MGGDDCECICNHSGACTGCGICWIKAYLEQQERQIRALFAVPGWASPAWQPQWSR